MHVVNVLMVPMPVIIADVEFYITAPHSLTHLLTRMDNTHTHMHTDNTPMYIHVYTHTHTLCRKQKPDIAGIPYSYYSCVHILNQATVRDWARDTLVKVCPYYANII